MGVAQNATAPHPPPEPAEGRHLLPASGEKGDTSTACAPPLPACGERGGEGKNREFEANRRAPTSPQRGEDGPKDQMRGARSERQSQSVGDDFETFPNEIRTRLVFSSPPIFPLVD